MRLPSRTTSRSPRNRSSSADIRPIVGPPVTSGQRGGAGEFHAASGGNHGHSHVRSIASTAGCPPTTTGSAESPMARYANILETIGNTPLVRLNKLAPAGANVYVKVESFNRMGSVKDRMARAVVEQAERSGALKPGQTVIEASSGNTGIGLAMVCAQKGYPLVVTMAESFSVERRKLLRFLGARVVLTPASEKGSGMLAKAVELADKHGWFLCRQFENEANADIHSRTTAREILDDFSDVSLDYWITGVGTGGTLKGVARVLKQARPAIKIVVTEPDNSSILGSGVR